MKKSMVPTGHAGEDLQADWCGTEDVGPWRGNDLGRSSQWGLSTLDIRRPKVPGLGKFEDGTNLGLFLKMEQSFCPNISGYIRIYQDCFGHVIRCYQMSSYFGGIYSDLRVPVIIYIPHNGWSICYSFCVESGLFVTQSQYFMWKMYIPKNWVTSSFFQFCSQFRTVFFWISTPFQSFYYFNSKSLLNTLW